jgi:hypothetical protein
VVANKFIRKEDGQSCTLEIFSCQWFGKPIPNLFSIWVHGYKVHTPLRKTKLKGIVSQD